ncbi:MAG: redoxin domain-containing protein [Candidatus Bathyarchaeia archaeon]
MSVEIGQKLPEFQLHDQDRKQRSMNEFLGKKTVVAFFPGAFTGPCTKEMCTFRDSMQTLPGQVVAISVNDPFTNKAFAEAHQLQFPILSDYSRDTIKKLNIFHNDFAGLKGYIVAKRSVFILDTNGVVRYKWVSEDPTKEPNYEEIKSTLAKL